MGVAVIYKDGACQVFEAASNFRTSQRNQMLVIIEFPGDEKTNDENVFVNLNEIRCIGNTKYLGDFKKDIPYKCTEYIRHTRDFGVSE